MNAVVLSGAAGWTSRSPFESEELAHKAATLRLVALSGYARPEDVAMAMEAGFDEHVAKPAGSQKLEQLLA